MTLRNDGQVLRAPNAAAVPLLGLLVIALSWLGLCDVIDALWPHGRL